MRFFLDEGKVDIDYDLARRGYAIGMKNGTSALQRLRFCPWCSNKLPDNLRDKWFETLEKEYNITDPFDEDRDKVPTEFRTDEWWKKRGL